MRLVRWLSNYRIARRWSRDLAGHDADALLRVNAVFQRAEMRRAAQPAAVPDRAEVDALRAAVEAVCVSIVEFADSICPDGTYDKKDKAWRVAHARRLTVEEVRAVLGDSAGTLAKVKAQALRDMASMLDAAWNRGHDDSVHPNSHLLRAEADRVEARRD